MDIRLVGFAVIVWVSVMIIAILNGVVRNAVYRERLGDLLSHQISTIILIALMFTVSFITFRFMGPESSTAGLLLVGAIWVTATIVFEFGFGHYVAGHSWEKLLTDYNILQGRIWGLFILTEFFVPLIISRIQLT